MISWVILALLSGDGCAPELDRLRGHEVTVLDAERCAYRIDSVAGEGAPIVGTVERRGEHLYLVEAGGRALRLTGPLAIPRIAGPRYKVWLRGRVNRAAGTVRAYRLGVLAPPAR